MNNFFNALRMFFAPPVFKGDEEKTRTAELVNTILISLTGVLMLALIGVVVGSRLIPIIIALIVVLILLLTMQIPLRRGYIKSVASSILILLTTLITFSMWSGGTVRAPAAVGLVLASIIAGLTISRRAAYWSTSVNILIFFGLTFAEISNRLPQTVQQTTLQQPIVFAALSLMTVVLLNQALRRVQTGIDLAKQSQDELTKLNVGLEQRVAERTKALETSAEVSRRLAAILDPRELASEVVTQVQTAFNYYYAQIYLFDEAGENLVLTAGTGEAGIEMLKRGHALPKGHGLVGRAAETKAPVLVSDTAQDPNWLPNDLLPDTKGEAAIPIISGDKVLGVLDVQDNVTNDINSGDITLLESLAGQVAIGLQNARQYQEIQNLQEQYALAVESSNDGIWDWDIAGEQIYYSPRWKSMLGFEEHELTKGFQDWEALIHPDDQAYANRSLNDYLEQKAAVYDVEVRLRHKNGTYLWIRDRGKALRDASGKAIRMVGAHSDITESKLAQESVAKRAAEQQTLNAITQKIQAATTIEEAMQVAARELGHALGNRQTLVALEPEILAETNK